MFASLSMYSILSLDRYVFQPPSLASLALTESALMRYHSDEPITITIGPMPQIENVNAQNR